MLHRKRQPKAGTKEGVALAALMENLYRGQCIDLSWKTAEKSYQPLLRSVLIGRTPRGDLLVSPAFPVSLPTIDTQSLEASVVLRDQHRRLLTRFGFFTTLIDRVDSLPQAKTTADSLILAAPYEVHRTNLRAAYRETIPSTLDIKAKLYVDSLGTGGCPVNLIDLSATGALVSYRSPSTEAFTIQNGEQVGVMLDFRAALEPLAVTLTPKQQARFQLSSLVVRQVEDPEHNFCFIALQFIELSATQEELVHVLLLKLQQWLAARQYTWGGSGWMGTLQLRQSHVQPMADRQIDKRMHP